MECSLRGMFITLYKILGVAKDAEEILKKALFIEPRNLDLSG